jgi:hypothetical protein
VNRWWDEAVDGSQGLAVVRLFELIEAGHA